MEDPGNTAQTGQELEDIQTMMTVENKSLMRRFQTTLTKTSTE